MAMTANCLACVADKSIEDFCNTVEGKNIPGCSGENSVRIDDMMVEMEVDATALNNNNQKSDTNKNVEGAHIEDGAARKHGNYGDKIKHSNTDYGTANIEEEKEPYQEVDDDNTIIPNTAAQHAASIGSNENILDSSTRINDTP